MGDQAPSSRTTPIALLGGGALVSVGSFLTWISGTIASSIPIVLQGSDIGLGFYTLVGGIAMALAGGAGLLAKGSPVRAYALGTAAAMWTAAVAIYIVGTLRNGPEVWPPGNENLVTCCDFSLSIGMYLVIAGALIALVAGLRELMRLRGSGEVARWLIPAGGALVIVGSVLRWITGVLAYSTSSEGGAVTGRLTGIDMDLGWWTLVAGIVMFLAGLGVVLADARRWRPYAAVAALAAVLSIGVAGYVFATKGVHKTLVDDQLRPGGVTVERIGFEGFIAGTAEVSLGLYFLAITALIGLAGAVLAFKRGRRTPAPAAMPIPPRPELG